MAGMGRVILALGTGGTVTCSDAGAGTRFLVTKDTGGAPQTLPTAPASGTKWCPCEITTSQDQSWSMAGTGGRMDVNVWPNLSSITEPLPGLGGVPGEFPEQGTACRGVMARIKRGTWVTEPIGAGIIGQGRLSLP